MKYSRYTPIRKIYEPDLSFRSDEEILEQMYICLRWINYFQDEDNRYLYMKIFEEVHREVKRRNLKIIWTSKDVKRFRILGARMYYGALSFRELEWRLGNIILYSIPTYRHFVKRKLYLVRESIEIIIDCIHDLGAWSELEYNRNVIATLDVPFFSYDTVGIMSKTLKIFFQFNENMLIFFLFLCETVLRTFLNPFWQIVDREYGSWKNILKVLMILLWITLYIVNLYE